MLTEVYSECKIQKDVHSRCGKGCPPPMWAVNLQKHSSRHLHVAPYMRAREECDWTNGGWLREGKCTDPKLDEKRNNKGDSDSDDDVNVCICHEYGCDGEGEAGD